MNFIENKDSKSRNKNWTFVTTDLCKFLVKVTNGVIISDGCCLLTGSPLKNISVGLVANKKSDQN